MVQIQQDIDFSQHIFPTLVMVPSPRQAHDLAGILLSRGPLSG
jgi:hypothetical protein